MAFTTGQTLAQLQAEIASAGTMSNGATVPTDAANNAAASAAFLPVNTLTVLYGILVKVTTSGQSAAAVFSYDTSPT